MVFDVRNLESAALSHVRALRVVCQPSGSFGWAHVASDGRSVLVWRVVLPSEGGGIEGGWRENTAQFFTEVNNLCAS